MKCPSCGSDQLVATVTLQRTLSLAARGGSVKIGGQKITQMDLKDAWDKFPMGDERPIKGPITCIDCGQDLFYVVGAPNNPYAGNHEEAEQRGADFFIEGGTL